MPRNINSSKLLAIVTVVGLASLAGACSDTPGVAANPPLPTDRSYNPAGPNCYPDINHCASYPTGGVSKDGPSPSK